MHPLVRFLFDNPLLLFLLVAWIGGAIARLARRKQAQNAAGGAPALPRRQPGELRRGDGPRSADEVAAEIRRALGLDGPRPAERVEPPVVVRREPMPVASPVRRQEVERPPTPVAPTTQQRRLELHSASHVGEQMQRRQTFRPVASSSRGLGGLGGRTAAAAVAVTRRRRFLPSDLAQAIVTAEVLGPPVALRGERRLF